MVTLSATIDAFVASREFDAATLGRLSYWDTTLGDRELGSITEDDVDLAIVQLAERGRLKPTRNHSSVATGKPLAGSTINRYISQLGSVYRYARRLRLLPRSHTPPDIPRPSGIHLLSFSLSLSVPGVLRKTIGGDL